MIIVCDLLCKAMSHEKVNSGFIYGLSLAFPNETIKLYADATHIEAIKSILVHDEIVVESFEFRPIILSKYMPFANILIQYFLLFRVFAELIKLDVNKVFFLSFSPEILYVIKKLKCIRRFSQLKFTFVLHGGFETIADDISTYPSIKLPRTEIPSNIKFSVFEKIARTKLKNLPIKVYRKVILGITKISWLKREPSFFTVKKVMEWNHSSDYRYIALSPHILRNAGKYIDLNQFDFYSVFLPTNFVKPLDAPVNTYAKFATFGYGDSLVLHNVAYLLEQKKITRPYEIRVIGMDNRGAEGFVNVTTTSKGEVLARKDMERHALDIDAFLILYDKKKYRLSCSGSILESLSMMKPVIHFDNDCINQFNSAKSPIGFCCYSLDEYIDKLADIIENYASYQVEFVKFRENILKLRARCAIEESASEIRKSFTWE